MDSVSIPLQLAVLVYDKPGRLSTKVETIDTRKPGHGDVLVNTTHSGVCRTYLSVMMRRWSYLILLPTMLLNAFTTLALWTCSSTLAPLLIFAILSGLANGSFFVTLPIAVARLVGEKQALRGISIALTGWTAGFLTGGLIAVFLIDSTNGDQQHSIVHYRPAIFLRRW